jgi:hypothetical protein
MTDARLCFSVRWAGSNSKIALLLITATNPAWLNSTRLQEQVALLANTDQRSTKILLGSPAGPQLTPVLFAAASVRKYTTVHDSPSYKAMVAAWSGLTTDQVFNVFVTRHSPLSVAVDDMARLYRNYDWESYFQRSKVYADLPLTLRCNPIVALAALDISELLEFSLPESLKHNKDFALAAVSRTRAYYTILQHFDASLYNDEEVVLKAVERNDREMLYASSTLATSRTFVLKAVSVNGLCIRQILPEFQSDKEAALAAVRQNTAAFKYLCDTLQADKDIQEACGTATQ